MAAIASISWSCSSPMSWHRSTEVGLLGVLWSPGPGSTSPPSADDSVWGGYPGVIKWGSRDRLGVTASGELSWDMIRDALIREVTFGGNTRPTTTSPCPLPGHDPASNGPSAVPLPLTTATVCLILPCRRTSCAWWARGGIPFKCD